MRHRYATSREMGGREMSPGDLLVVDSRAGYGVAYPMRSAKEWGSITVLSGTACLYLGPDEVETDLRMQPMVRIMVDGQVLSMDVRFLQEVS